MIGLASSSLHKLEFVPHREPLFLLWVRKFIEMSGEHERDVDSVCDQMRELINSGRGRLWSFEGRHPFSGGYMLAEIIQTEHNTIAVMVNQVYVDPRIASDMWPALHDAADEFGRERGASEMYFLTRRNPQAFERRLGRGWKVDATVMRRPIL